MADQTPIAPPGEQAHPVLTQEQVDNALWERGELSWLLKPCQQSMLEAIQANPRFKYVIKCARRLGKSYLLCCLAVMVCLRKPRAQVRYAAPTAKALRKIVRPIMGKILNTCPKHLRPCWLASEGMYQFPNGSEIHLAGVSNGHADDLRGTECDLFLIDEARDIDELDYLVHDVAMPQFLDVDGNVVKGRRLVVASSPAQNKAHEFSIMADEAKAEGCYSHFDIFAGGYSHETIRMFFKEDGLPETDVEALIAGRPQDVRSSTVKREYLALDVIDEESAVIAEWGDAFVFERQSTEFDKFFHRYMFMDIGVQKDLTVIQFALYDFIKAQLYLEDELVVTGPLLTTDVIAREIKAKLEERPEYKNAYRKIADNSHPLLLNDLSRLHDIHFTATTKDRLHEMVNALKIWIRNGKLGANPRCKHTVGCLESAVWNKPRTEFAHSKVFGHYDAVAALVYGTRGTDVYTNPIPPLYGIDRMNTVIFINQPRRLSPAALSLAETFGLKPRR